MTNYDKNTVAFVEHMNVDKWRVNDVLDDDFKVALFEAINDLTQSSDDKYNMVRLLALKSFWSRTERKAINDFCKRYYGN